MKSAISNAVATYAQAADHRHPRSIRPTPVIGVPATGLADQQAERIVELEGRLASARGENHDLRNQLAAADGSLRILALRLGLSEDTPPAQIVDAAIARAR